MNRTNNSQKLYAQAAAQQKTKQASHTNNPHHQNQQHHHQQVSQQNQASGPSTSSNFSSSANGKPINNLQTKPQAQHNSTMGNGNTGRSAPIKQKSAVQLPKKGHAWESAPTSIVFGSIGTPNAQLSSSPSSTGQTLTSGGGLPESLPTKGVPTFGTLQTNNTITPTTQATQATSTTVGISGSGVNNISNNNNSNNNGISKPPITARANEIPRTHSAPPLFQDSNNRNVGQSNVANVGPARNQPNNIHQQQSAAVSHQQSSASVSNPPLNHRKDSVSSTVSSNDGQPAFHPHHSPHHPNHTNHTNQHGHPHYSPHPRQHPQHTHHNNHHKPIVPQSPYSTRPRDKSIPLPSPHLAPQPVPTQGALPPQMPIYNNYAAYGNRDSYPHPPLGYYPGYVTPIYAPMQYVQRPQMPQAHIPQVNTVSFQKPQNKAIVEIIDPVTKNPIRINSLQQQQQFPKNQNYKREEALTAVSDKNTEDLDRERSSSAVPIVDPAEKDKEERERKEREEAERLVKEKEEQERKEREEREERERKEREEQERLTKEKEEKERKERKEREEREERERKEREEQERLAKEKEEKERKEREEREERERKEREEQERLAKEKEEKERKEREEREERERKEREEQERLAKEKEEKERKEREEREERERKEREEAERLVKVKEEQERKELEEREERERKEREEAERLAKEKELKAQEEKRREEEERERQEAERKEKEEEEAKAKLAAEDVDKKREAETSDKKDSKKEKFNKGHRPGPLDLSRTTSAPAIPSAPLSALGSARIIDDLSSVQYPPHIKSPNPALNSNAEPGKFKYDRTFLMQFMNVCKDKPENLPALDAIGMDEPKDDKKNSRTSNSRTSTGSRPMHKGSPNQSQFSSMGEFKLPKTTSEERFAASLRNGTSTGIFGRTPLGRTGSGSTLLPAPSMSSTVNPPSPRTSSGRRDNRRNVKSGYQMQGPNVGQEQVAPLERSENRWVPSIFDTILPKATDDFIPIESVQRKVKALLNKLTLEKFDSISDQIIDYANKSRDERDGRILREVIRLIFEKSCDESNFCAMYAQLCRKMMERVDPEIVDENVRNTEGKFVQGGTLFRKYLLNRCQEEFEKGWKVNIPLPSNEKGEPDLMSDEYYAAAKAKRQGLGLIRFIGELFKLNMLTERIMHECIKKLIIFQGSPEEAEMESLCKLMNTVGEQLDHIKPNPHEQIKSNQIDHTKAKKYMDSYFERLEDISKLPNLSSRIKFMIMDLIDLRSNVWKPRRDINAPKTIAEIHEDAAKQKEDDYMKRTTSSGGRGMPKFAEQMSRSGSGRREHRSDKGMGPHGSSASGNDGWSTVGGSSSQRNKVGDLTKFGSVTRSKITGSVNLAPGGILGSLSGGAKGWISKNDNKDREDKAIGLSRTNSTTNMYSVLTADNSEGRKSSESEAQKPSPPMERKKIILAPRTKGITNEDSQAADKPASKSTSEGASSVQSMPEELATKRINNMMEEYFSILDDREVILCLKEIPTEYHAKAIESFANKVIEKKQKDVDNVVKLFKEIVSSGTCDTDTFKNGFKATLEFLMDIGADAPMAYSFTGQLLFSAGLDFRDITKLLKPLDDDMAIEKIVKGYASALKNKDEQKYVQKINEFEFKTLFPLKSKDDINKFLEDLGGSSKK